MKAPFYSRPSRHGRHPCVRVFPRRNSLVALRITNGFVFAGDYLSDAILEEYEKDLEDLQESDELPGEPCDAFRKSLFNVRMLELVAAVRNEVLDSPTLGTLTRWRQLGESLTSPQE